MSTNNNSKGLDTNSWLIMVIFIGIGLYSALEPLIEKINSRILFIEELGRTVLPYVIAMIPIIVLLLIIVYLLRKLFYNPATGFHTDVKVEELLNDEDDFQERKTSEPKVQSSPARQENFLSYQPPKINIVLDTHYLLGTHLHADDNLSNEEREYIKKFGFIPKEFVPLGEQRRRLFYIKERKPESLEHTFVVYSIFNYLRDSGLQDIATFATQKPDIVFNYDGKEHAFEIETPFYLKKKHRRLTAKTEVNNKQYPNKWWIVPTRSAYARSFKRYGKVLTRSQVLQWIEFNFPKPESEEACARE